MKLATTLTVSSEEIDFGEMQRLNHIPMGNPVFNVMFVQEARKHDLIAWARDNGIRCGLGHVKGMAHNGPDRLWLSGEVVFFDLSPTDETLLRLRCDGLELA